MTRPERSILLVEDDSDIREDLSALLHLEEYRVLQAGNGREALEILRRTELPCCILLDLMMPVMNGWELRLELLADPRLRSIPVLIVSGAADVAEEVERLQAQAFVRKPFEMGALLRMIAQYC